MSQIGPQNPCATALGRRVTEALADRKTRFVFPTQTSADSWAEAVLRYGNAGAVETDRFLSLDALVAGARGPIVPQDKKPADQALRLLWANGVLGGGSFDHSETSGIAHKSKGKGPALTLGDLAKPEFPATKSQILFLARVAPYLAAFADRVDSAIAAGTLRQLSGETRDFLVLNANYQQFLEAHNAYEPLHFVPDFNDDGFVYLVFAPELAFSYVHYADKLKSGKNFHFEDLKHSQPFEDAPGPRVADTSGNAGGDAAIFPNLMRFGNFREEFDWVFGTCRKLIENGSKPSELAISVPVLSQRTKAYLEETATRWQVPIEFKMGEKLSAYPFGQMLRALVRAASEGLSLGSLRSLIGINAFPWKQRKAAIDLIHFGEQYSIPESSADKHYMAKLWPSTFSISVSHNAKNLHNVKDLQESKDSRDAFLFYTELKKSCDALYGADSFLLVRTTLFDFRQRFLDESNLPAGISASLERTLDELDTLVEYETTFGAKTPNAFSIFMALLDMVVYNPPVSNLDKIPVFSYQTGVMVASALHFVLECSQDALQGFTKWSADFPEEIFEQSELAALPDALVLESFDVNRAVFCHADEGLSGFSVPNAWFASANAHVVDMTGEKERNEGEADSIGHCPEVYEEAAWFSEDPSHIPGVLPGYLKDAALGQFNKSTRHLPPQFARDILSEPRVLERGIANGGQTGTLDAADATDGADGADKLVALLNALPTGFSRGEAVFNPSRLESYAACPFKWLISIMPDVVLQEDNAVELSEGSLTHAIISKFFTAVQSRDGRFVQDHLPEYESLLDSAFEQALAETIRNSGPALEPALRAAFPRVKSRLYDLFNFEAAFEQAGWSIGTFEVPLRLEDTQAGAVLEGRADRIAEKRAEHGTALALVDFKKKNTPKRSEFYLDKDSKLKNLQLAAYTEILASQGAIVETAFYWSIEKSKPVYVFSLAPQPKTKNPDEFLQERKAVRTMLEDAAQSVRAGQFMEIRPSRDACNGCQWRALCRAHYALEAL